MSFTPGGHERNKLSSGPVGSGSPTRPDSRRGPLCRGKIAPWAIGILALLFSCAPLPMREPVPMSEMRSAGMATQTQEFTCGAAALATTLSALGRPTREREILDRLLADSAYVRDHGADSVELPPLSAADLQRIARSLGFKAVTLRAAADSEALKSLEKLKPVICRILLYEEYLHFVVVRDVADGWLFISDPAYGNVRLPIEQFGRAWEAGDRMILAVSGRPFPAWKSETGQVYITRDPEERVVLPEETVPLSLYQSSLRSITLSNTVME